MAEIAPIGIGLRKNFQGTRSALAPSKVRPFLQLKRVRFIPDCRMAFGNRCDLERSGKTGAAARVEEHEATSKVYSCADRMFPSLQTT